MILAAAMLPNGHLLHAGPSGHGPWLHGPLASRTQAESEADCWSVRLASEQVQVCLSRQGLDTHQFLFKVANRNIYMVYVALSHFYWKMLS